MSCKFFWFFLDFILLICKIIILTKTRFCLCEKYNKIDFIMTNASMSLRSMFFKNDYRSNCWQKLNKNFHVIVFRTSNHDFSRNKICSSRDVVVWNEQKDINDQDHTNKSSHQDTRVKKKKRRSIETSKISFFFSWCIRRRRSINIFIYSTRVIFFFLSSFFDEFVKKNSQSNCNNSVIIWNKQKKSAFVFLRWNRRSIKLMFAIQRQKKCTANCTYHLMICLKIDQRLKDFLKLNLAY
jgi:hypothetical protein